MTNPVPVRISDNLLLRSNEYRDRTHPMGILGASLDACEGSNGVIYYDSNLLTLSPGTGKHCRLVRLIQTVGNGD
jgi:hypothetical protein